MVVLDIIYVAVKVSIKKVRRNRERRHLQHQQFAAHHSTANHSLQDFHRPDVAVNFDQTSLKSFRSQNQNKTKMAFQNPPLANQTSPGSRGGSRPGSRVDLIKD